MKLGVFGDAGNLGNISYTPEPWARNHIGAQGFPPTWIPRVYSRDQMIPAEAPYAQIDRPWTTAELAASGNGYGDANTFWRSYPPREDYTSTPSAAAAFGAWVYAGTTPYGAEAAPSPEVVQANTAAIVQSTVPVISNLIASLQDPVKRAAVLEQKIKYAKLRGASPRRIAVMQARLDAARRESGLRVEGETATRTWRTLGQTTLIVGVGVGLALTYMLVKIANAGRKP